MDKNCSTFQKKHVGQYSEEIGIFEFQKFHLLVTFFSLFAIFTVYILNNSFFIYKKFSTFQIKHFGQYSNGIGFLQFENLYLLITLF